MASVRCLDSAFGYDGYGSGATDIPDQGRILRNIVEGADMVMSHILHFYHLAALDYIDTDTPGSIIENQSPWSPAATRNRTDVVGPSLGGSALVNTLVLNYVGALNVRRKCHELAAYISGKQPHTPAFIPGGITSVVDDAAISAMSDLITGDGGSWPGIIDFVDNTYIPDVVTVAKALSGSLLVGAASAGVGEGCKKYLAYGTFPNLNAPVGEPLNAGEGLLIGGFLNTDGISLGSWNASAVDKWKIKEYIKYSHYEKGLLNAYDGLLPINGVTKVDYQKVTNGSPSASYSWAKAPRYVSGSEVHVCEVGPLARVLVNYARGNEAVVYAVNNLLTGALAPLTTANVPNLRSVLGRHAARALECSIIANTIPSWITSLTPNTSAYRHLNIPTSSATGAGFTEAPRGALSHWIRIDGKKISNYQCVVPTTWNVSPKDTNGQHGPIEHAISGTSVATTADYIKMTRIIRSFDPCIACTVHVVSPDKKKVTKFEVGTASSTFCNSK